MLNPENDRLTDVPTQCTLLLIGDGPQVLDSLTQALRGEGCRVLAAASAAAGLELLSQHEIGVIVADQHLPGMTGIEFLDATRARFPDAVRILLTASGGLETVTAAVNRGVVFRFLFKPCADALLVQALREAFRHYQLSRQNKELVEQAQRANEDLQRANRQLLLRVEDAQRELARRAHYDPLTDLPNRYLLSDRTEQAVAHALRNGHKIAVMVVDLDRFKLINETLGQGGGDELLQIVALRLRGCVPVDGTVARQGGDEFLCLLPELETQYDAELVARKILEDFRAPFGYDGQEFYLTASIGIGMYPYDGDSCEALMKNAEAAMYHAKDQGRNNYQFYARDMNALAIGRLMLESSLRHALQRNEFQLHYQPQVDLSSGRIIGMEALLRWRHPDLGMLPPTEVVHLLEETGLIDSVGEWILRTACEQARAWLDAGLPRMRLGVNLSARQLRQRDLPDRIARILDATGLDPGLEMLDIELTESVIMDDAETTLATLRDLSALGVKLSIDDFGTGYSSLSYLRRFPVHMLKIDQSFVRDLDRDPDAAAIVAAIVALAHSLKLRAIAEGVETGQQLAALRAMGCDEFQGYLFSRPIPAEQVLPLLQQHLADRSTASD